MKSDTINKIMDKVKAPKLPTAKQLNIQLKVWKRENRRIYNNIIAMADAHGVLVKGNTITINKKKKKLVEKFSQVYQENYGSYSAWHIRQKARRKAYENKSGRKYKSQKEFEDIGRILLELENKIFEAFEPSDAYHIVDKADHMSDTEAVDFLQNILDQKKKDPKYNPLEKKQEEKFSSEDVKRIFRS